MMHTGASDVGPRPVPSNRVAEAEEYVKLTLFGLALLLSSPTSAWSGSEERERLEPIDVDPRAALTIWYPGDPKQSIFETGPQFRPSISVVEGERVPISRSPDGTCPKVKVDLDTYPENPELLFEDDGRHVWAPQSSSETSEDVDIERCEVVIVRARSQIRWERIPIKRPDARVRKHLEEAGLSLPADAPPQLP